jgi:HAD superfamily hydrolase (TIGR01450 family)
LYERYDRLLVDLDGVAYLGDQPIAGAAEALTAARDAGNQLVFVTNNAARPPGAVADQLVSMGIAARPDEVMTSAIAAAGVVAARHPPGARILVVGGDGVRDALVGVGLMPVGTADDEPVAVLQGFAPDIGWRALAEAAVAVRAGAEWIATNVDATLPSARGPLPGNGSLVAALATATGQQPEVIGKPEPFLFDAALGDGDRDRALVVGDRLDTDIAGARRAGLSALLVLSGVSGPRDLLLAASSARPHYVGRDLGALGQRHPAVAVHDGAAECAGTRARLVDGTIRLESGGDRTGDGLDGLRALCALTWSMTSATDPTSLPEPYQRALDDLDLHLR